MARAPQLGPEALAVVHQLCSNRASSSWRSRRSGYQAGHLKPLKRVSLEHHAFILTTDCCRTFRKEVQLCRQKNSSEPERLDSGSSSKQEVTHCKIEYTGLVPHVLYCQYPLLLLMAAAPRMGKSHETFRIC